MPSSLNITSLYFFFHVTVFLVKDEMKCFCSKHKDKFYLLAKSKFRQEKHCNGCCLLMKAFIEPTMLKAEKLHVGSCSCEMLVADAKNNVGQPRAIIFLGARLGYWALVG